MSILKKIYNYMMSNECIENLEYYLSFPPEDIANLYAIRAAYYANLAIYKSKVTINKIDNYKKYVIKIANSAATDANLHSAFIDGFLDKYFNLNNRKLLIENIKTEVKNDAINKAIITSQSIKKHMNNIIDDVNNLNVENMINQLYKELENDWEIINK